MTTPTDNAARRRVMGEPSETLRAALVKIAADGVELNTPGDYARGWNDARFRLRQIAEAALAAAIPPEQDGYAEGQREGCVGTMNAERATYFLERFKREEKLLGPHEQWALDYTIAILATDRHAEGRIAGLEEAAKIAEASAATSVPLMKGPGVSSAVEQGRHRAATEIAAAIRSTIANGKTAPLDLSEGADRG